MVDGGVLGEGVWCFCPLAEGEMYAMYTALVLYWPQRWIYGVRRRAVGEGASAFFPLCRRKERRKKRPIYATVVAPKVEAALRRGVGEGDDVFYPLTLRNDLPLFSIV